MKNSAEEELWAAVLGWEGYAISTLGKVRSKRGSISTFLIKDYHAFNVSRGARRASLRVHREMLRSFIGDQPKLLARHLNDDHHDNRLANLAWGDAKQNEMDKFLNGHSMIGSKHHQAKLSEDQVKYIRWSKRSGMDLSRLFKVTPTCICSIRRGRSWMNMK